MKFQDLPSTALSRILGFLDPRSRIMFLLACENFYTSPKVADPYKKQTLPKYYCYFCFSKAVFREMTHEADAGDHSVNLRYHMRNKKISQTLFRAVGSGRLWTNHHYRRRHYSESNCDPEINHMQLYLGKVQT